MRCEVRLRLFYTSDDRDFSPQWSAVFEGRPTTLNLSAQVDQLAGLMCSLPAGENLREMTTEEIRAFRRAEREDAE